MKTDAKESAERLAKRARKLCFFCLKSAAQVPFLVEAETGARICGECVEECRKLIAREGPR